MSASTAITVSPAKLQANLSEVLRTKERLESKLKKTASATEAHVGTVVTGMEIVGLEFGLGYSRGRFGEKQLAGIPAEVWGGLGLHFFGFTGIAGKYSEHLHALGTASLAFAVTVEGLKLGQEHRHAAQQPAPAEQRRQPATQQAAATGPKKVPGVLPQQTNVVSLETTMQEIENAGRG